MAKYRSIFGCNKGSVTLESTLIFPVLLLCILLIVFVIIYHFYSIMLLAESLAIVERVAYNWDNKHKEHRSGDFEQRDHLYWSLLSRISQHKTLTFSPSGNASEPSSRLSELLNQSHHYYHYYHEGTLHYEQKAISKLEVKLSSKLPLNYFDTELQRESSAYLIHPSSFLYDYQFFRYVLDNMIPQEQQQRLMETITNR